MPNKENEKTFANPNPNDIDVLSWFPISTVNLMQSVLFSTSGSIGVQLAESIFSKIMALLSTFFLFVLKIYINKKKKLLNFFFVRFVQFFSIISNYVHHKKKHANT